jgi:hypothetical protein
VSGGALGACEVFEHGWPKSNAVFCKYNELQIIAERCIKCNKTTMTVRARVLSFLRACSVFCRADPAAFGQPDEAHTVPLELLTSLAKVPVN